MRGLAPAKAPDPRIHQQSSWPGRAWLVPAISLEDARHCQGKRDHRDKPGDDKADHSALSLASRITLLHFCSSDFRYAASSPGVPAIDSKYCRSRKLVRNSGSAKMRRVSALILATMSGAVPAGA